MRQLPQVPFRVFEALCSTDEAVTVPDLARRLGLDQAQVDPAVRWLAEQGWAEMIEETFEEYRLGKEGQKFSDGRLPERLVIEGLSKAGGSAELPELAELTGLEKKTVGQSLKWLAKKGWAEKSGKTLTLTDEGRKALEAGPGPDEQLVALLGAEQPLTRRDMEAKGLDVEAMFAAVAGRSGLLKVKERVLRKARATDAGRAVWAEGVEGREEVNELTPELLKDGAWRKVSFRPYDLALESYRPPLGKTHPFGRVLAQTRRVFLEMGFSEVTSPSVESAFWDFDALFQPQDHPAREMQDTFYVARPARAKLPDSELVARVKATHENGWETGSVGWRTPWEEERASKVVLRTHTTAATVRALARDPNPPRKVFCVGRVYRRETIDYKHLPVFHQVDGIIIDEHGSFAALLGTLEAFYRKMGFARFEFRPAFFPYTEPSVEVFVWHEGRKDWVAMGGAGVFRPEVTEPLGCKVPVLAWGLGLERLAMFRYDLSDIRQTCLSDVEWLKETPICR